MPMTKRVWLTIGNVLLGIWIVCSGVFSFYILPYLATRDLAPYTKTVANTMRALFYAPYLIPPIIIIFVMVFYYRSERNIQKTAISLGILMFLVSFASTLFYLAGEQDFLDGYVIYQGNCEPLNIGIFTEGNRKNLYVNFTCDNDPSYVFRVWDPDIIAYVINNPEVSSLPYRLSANHTLLPIESTPAKK